MSEDTRKGEKETLGNTLDYYNDEISRKAVGKLFDSAEDTNKDKADDIKADTGINNHFYEDARAEANEESGSIVKGFSRRSAREENSDTEESEKPIVSERERYRRQFLDDFDKDPRRARNTSSREKDIERSSRVKKITEDEETAPRRRRSYALEDAGNDDIGQRGIRLKEIDRANAEDHKIGSSKEEIHYKKIERAPRTSSRRFERDNIQTSAQGIERFESKQEDNSNSNILKTPIFTIMCSAAGVMLLVLVFLIIRLNMVSGQLKEYKENANTLLEEKAEVDNLRKEKEAAEGRYTQAMEDNAALKLKIIELEGSEAETPEGPEETGQEAQAQTGETTYTVVAGDSLGKISNQFYQNYSGVEKIKQANGLTSDDLKVGQELKIPQ